MFIAHKAQDGREQSIKDHLQETAALADQYSVDELNELCRLIALLHDVGKYQTSFQKRINGANIAVDHSTCGAQEACRLLGKTPGGIAAAFCISGHHGGLPDGGTPSDVAGDGTLQGRLSKEMEDYSAYRTEIGEPAADLRPFYELLKNGSDCREDQIEKFAFIIRYLFSCLKDADIIDTQMFENGEDLKKPDILRGVPVNFTRCLRKINEYIDAFSPVTDLQKARSKLQEAAYRNAEEESDVYLLNMPTGSGKTICSFKLAVEMAIKYKKRRIIYIIPYNSIIDQTVQVFENVLGGSNEILRHQSTFTYEKEEDAARDGDAVKSRACENWDAGIIVTTAVQFFESVYSNKASRLRKLHNMADSILVFDEAHLMPISYMAPCIRSIYYITSVLHSKALFLTATMPNFQRLFREFAAPDIRIRELITDRSEFRRFHKCSFSYLGERSEEQLLSSASEKSSALIVVNKKDTARRLYTALQGNKYHLSTYMSVYDRKRTLDCIKKDLERVGCGELPAVRVVSTSLIEAGVDLDFQCVYRELTGLDSILQSGGRCNREGERENAVSYIFKLEKETLRDDGRINITEHLLREFDDIRSPRCIEEYYDRYYACRYEEMGANLISRRCSCPQEIPFRDYADRFSLIDGGTISIVVPNTAEAVELVERLKRKDYSAVRKLDYYSASVKIYEFEELLRQGAVSDHGTGVYILNNPDYYDSNTGILLAGKDIII